MHEYMGCMKTWFFLVHPHVVFTVPERIFQRGLNEVIALSKETAFSGEMKFYNNEEKNQKPWGTSIGLGLSMTTAEGTSMQRSSWWNRNVGHSFGLHGHGYTMEQYGRIWVCTWSRDRPASSVSFDKSNSSSKGKFDEHQADLVDFCNMLEKIGLHA